MRPSGFRLEDIIGLLADLEARLNTRGVALDIQIVGGAALLLHGLIDRATGDIDARYASAATVEQVARKRRHGWPLRVALRPPFSWQTCQHLPL
ncbi:DUF6036 family nucleotidyltransferase [Paeniglutamicibacter gangotriensis]|uniref:DUF6036 family nucleotidyltransferase n=1 Tax=Paeniglutamicibacter gangotriensis TaxID=254787 RepID=UPI002AA29E44|nr:DUF6036 family nucleotidyltransferase [Paeniglutamicibacter gangotriensis]